MIQEMKNVETELWHSDINITDDFARKMIERQFSELAPVEIKCIGEGWDNKVFLVNEKYIFRFPHRKIAATLIERENSVLKHLQSILNLKIPNPIYIGMPNADYPYHIQGYQIIDGVSGCHAALTLSERISSIKKLAIFLKKLHSIHEKQAREIGADYQVFDRMDVNGTINNFTERVDKINIRKIASIDLQVFNQEIQIAKAIKLPVTKVLVHGDLYCRHLMFDKSELVGIIDWGDVGINNPAVDLSVIFSFYPESCHGTFFDIYGSVDSQTLTYARFLGLYSAMTIMLYGHDINDTQLVHEARDSILRINPKLFSNKST